MNRTGLENRVLRVLAQTFFLAEYCLSIIIIRYSFSDVVAWAKYRSTEKDQSLNIKDHLCSRGAQSIHPRQRCDAAHANCSHCEATMAERRAIVEVH